LFQPLASSSPRSSTTRTSRRARKLKGVGPRHREAGSDPAACSRWRSPPSAEAVSARPIDECCRSFASSASSGKREARSASHRRGLKRLYAHFERQKDYHEQDPDRDLQYRSGPASRSKICRGAGRTSTPRGACPRRSPRHEAPAPQDQQRLCTAARQACESSAAVKLDGASSRSRRIASGLHLRLPGGKIENLRHDLRREARPLEGYVPHEVAQVAGTSPRHALAGLPSSTRRSSKSPRAARGPRSASAARRLRVS
jgi:hypothetical protein